MSTKLILIPGLGGDATLWADQVRALSPAIDVHATEAHFEADSIAAMAAAILDQDGGPMIVGGTSMGGFIALEMIRQAPRSIAGIALFGTSARIDPPETAAARRNMIATIERDGFDSFVQTGWRRAVHPSRHGDAGLAARIVNANRRIGVERYVAQVRAIIERRETVSVLASIACPAVVACGREDILMPFDDSRELAGAIRGAQLRVIEACGHMCSTEQPAAVSQILAELVARVRIRSQ